MSENTTEAVVRIVRETLALSDRESVAPEQLLFYDLGFTSMDLVDFLFRIEEELGVEISEATLSEQARGDMPLEAFVKEGRLSEAGRTRLLALLPDTPPELFPPTVEAQTLPRYCTVGAVARFVDGIRAGR